MPACDDRIAARIPWYANGTLEPQERQQVEAHLRDCAGCRELLDKARLFREVGRDLGEEELLRHVSARLLHDHVLRPGSLGTETAAWIRSHLEACETSRRTTTIVSELERKSRAAVSLWQRLSRTLLHPVPALAYLLIVLAGAGYVMMRGSGLGRTTPEVLVLPEAVRLFGETGFRDPGDPADMPVDLSVPADGGPLRLTLMTDLLPVEIEEDGVSLVLTLSTATRDLWSRSIPPDAVGAEGGLDLLVPLDDLPEDGEVELVLLLIRPGDDPDDQAVFRQLLRFR